MLKLRIAVLLAMLTPVGALPAHAAETAAQDELRATRAAELAALLNSTAELRSQIDRVLDGISTQAFATDPNLRLLKEEYPGVEKVFRDTMRPIMLDAVEAMMPAYNADTAAFFARNFTAAELGELLGFWNSPAGRTVLGQTVKNADFAAITKEVVEQMGNEELQLSSAAIDADKRKAATAAVRDLSSENRAAVIRFGLTPTGIKMRRLLPEKNQIDHKWANRDPSPETVARIEREVPAALSAFIEAESSKRAGAK